MEALTKIRQFVNCTFSASLWKGTNYVVFCQWEGGETTHRVYELCVDSEEEAIQTFVEVVQTFRKLANYANYEK